MDINIIELIEEVKTRPLLWDKNSYDYNNRVLVALGWDEVARKFDKDKSIVKQKWHNLRTQFKRELKKIAIPYGKPTKPIMEYYRGQWVHFEKMLFLKVSISGTSQIRTTDEEDITELDSIEEDLEKIISKTEDTLSPDTYYDSDTSKSNETDITMPEPLIVPKQELNGHYEFENIQSNEYPANRNQKRKSECHDNQLQAKVVKMEDEGSDDDLYFMKSILPYFKTLSPIRKLLVRNEIQNLLIRESLYEKCTCQQERP